MNNRNLIIACVTFSGIFWILYACLVTSYTSQPLSEYTSDEQGIATLSVVTATINGETEVITLPYEFNDLESRTSVTVEATFLTPEGGYFYFESEYTPVIIYANGEEIYSYGQDGSYYQGFQDPPLSGQLVNLNTSSETIQFTIEYLSPSTTDSFYVDTIIFGTQAAIYESLFLDMGFTLIFSTVLILVSIFIICIILIVMIFEKRSITFLWLGLACLTSGLWLLCENPLLNVFIYNPTRFYIMSFYGMLLFPTPLIYFALTTVHFHNQKPLLYLAIVQLIAALTSVVTQLFGITSFALLAQFFNIFVPVSITLLAFCLLYEYIHYHNKSAQRFAIPSVILAIFTIFEFANNRLHFANTSITFFQIGIMIFMLSMGIIGGYYIKDSIALKDRSTQMEFTVHMMEFQAKNLKRQSTLILETSENLKKQRHDLRHQLTAIRELATHETIEQLNTYLDTIVTNIPSKQLFYCNNVTINSIISHYSFICQRSDIELSVEINIPTHSTDELDADYCIIFGNLLENATEACQFMVEGKRFIKLNSRMRYNTLIITMENSFDGQYKEDHGKFHSRKRADYGIGLTSIQAAANKYDGDAQFKNNGKTFLSSIYMSLFND